MGAAAAGAQVRPGRATGERVDAAVDVGALPQRAPAVGRQLLAGVGRGHVDVEQLEVPHVDGRSRLRDLARRLWVRRGPYPILVASARWVGPDRGSASFPEAGGLFGPTVALVVDVDGVRRFDPPRRVRVRDDDGAWWLGWCERWTRQADGTWRALCRWTTAPGMQYVRVLPDDRVELAK